MIMILVICTSFCLVDSDKCTPVIVCIRFLRAWCGLKETILSTRPIREAMVLYLLRSSRGSSASRYATSSTVMECASQTLITILPPVSSLNCCFSCTLCTSLAHFLGPFESQGSHTRSWSMAVPSELSKGFSGRSMLNHVLNLLIQHIPCNTSLLDQSNQPMVIRVRLAERAAKARSSSDPEQNHQSKWFHPTQLPRSVCPTACRRASQSELILLS